MKAKDKIVAFDGVRTDDWGKLSDLIRDSAARASRSSSSVTARR